MNLKAVAAAIATRFSASAITPPSGYGNVVTSTHLLPNNITGLPTNLVFVPTFDWSYYAARRVGDMQFVDRFYVQQAADRPTAVLACYDWMDVLMEQLEPQFDLDLAPIITHAVIVSGTAGGTLPYGGKEYIGLEFVINVHYQAAISPTT